MNQSTERLLGMVMMAAMAGLWAYNSWVLQPEKQRQRQESRAIEDSQRFRDWAFVAKEKQIAPGETVRLVVIPSPLGHEMFDTKCLIYTHQEFRVSSMICPDANQNDIASSE